MRPMGRSNLASDEAGAAAVEFALVLPLLLLTVWGVIEISRAFYTLNNLASALRDGARLGAVCNVQLKDVVPNMAGNAQALACRTAIRDRVTQAFQPLGPALAASAVAVTVDLSGNLTVQADYPYAPLTPLPGWTFTMTRKAVFRYERG